MEIKKYLFIVLLFSTLGQLYSAGFDPAPHVPTLTQRDLNRWRKTPNIVLVRGIFTHSESTVITALADGASSSVWYDSGAVKFPILLMAARYGSVSVVERLLKHNADINARDTNGRTPLMAACAADNVPVVEYLLSKKADTALHDINNNSALAQAIYFNKLQSLGLLACYGCDMNERMGETEDTALIVASDRGYATAVAVLLRYGLSPFERNKRNESALEHARAGQRRNKQIKDKEKELRFKQTVGVLTDYQKAYVALIHEALDEKGVVGAASEIIKEDILGYLDIQS